MKYSPVLVLGTLLALNCKANLLNMDVHWVLQGYSIYFHGFLVEFLGFTSSILKLMPNTRVMQSSFKHTFQDSPFKDESAFMNGLFPKEKENMIKLLSKEVNAALIDNLPVSLFAPSLEVDAAACLSRMEADYFEVGGEMSKGMLSADSSMRCCEECRSNVLCVGWTFDSSSNSCSLKASQSTHGVPREGFTSGKMIANGKSRPPAPRAIIFHGTTCIHNNHTMSFGKRDVNTILIGRYMLERSDFRGGLNSDEYAVAACAGTLDEVWVPTEWHRLVFERFMKRQGVRAPMISVIAEAVDTDLFVPTRKYSTAYAVQADGTQMQAVHVEENVARPNRIECSLVAASSGQGGGRVQCSDGRKFKFLSIFKWEHRKGWDVLLDGYWQAFGPEDDVVLQIRSYLPSFKAGNDNITEVIAEYAMTSRGKALSELAAVEWLAGGVREEKSEAMSRMDIHALYSSVQAFVLPTRGEGWGLPIAEAMAMELPVIVTNYSGPAAYASEENAYFLSVLPELDDMSFAQPNATHLAELMRKVVSESTVNGAFAALEKARKARETMKMFSADSIVAAMNDRLRFHAKLRGWTFP